VHGSDRGAARAVPKLRALAEEHRGVVLSPVFAMDLDHAEPDMVGTVMAGGGLRPDLALLAMVAELGELLETSLDQRLLWGFSYGGRFVSRFAYLHPHELTAAAAGGSGWTTMPWDDRDWWVGVRDVEARFGTAVDWAGLAKLPYLLTVGEHDTDEGAAMGAYSPVELEAMGLDAVRLDAYGRNRRARTELLAAALWERGVPVELEVVPGVGHHDYGPMHSRVWDFFERAMGSGRRTGR
jgi:pimeloyl-ACP methyl ester carboxylesterase